MSPFAYQGQRSTDGMCLAVMKTPMSGERPLVIYWDGPPTCQLPSGHEGIHRDADYQAQWSARWTEQDKP